MTKWLLITLTLVLGLQAKAQSYPYGDSDSDSTPPAPVSTMSDDDLVAMLVQDMSANVKTLGREAIVFHYQDSNAYGGAPTSDIDPALPSRARSRIAYFWQQVQNDSPSFYGAGFYAAMDPVVSRSYGGDNFKLITVKLHASMKYYDDSGVYFSAESSELRSRNCSADVSSLLSNYGPCRNLILKALAQLHVDFLAYDWSSQAYPGCDYSTMRAFVLMNARAFRDSDFNFYFKQIPANDPHAAEREQIELYSRVVGGPIWPDLSPSSTQADPAWLKQNIMSCSNFGS